MSTGIEWTDETWNPVTGCTKVSPGCDHCYAERITNRFGGPGAFDKLVLHEDRLDQPFHWRKPRRVFVNSMSDLFHKDVPTLFIGRVFNVMGANPQHTFQVLTKRPGPMAAMLKAYYAAIDSEPFANVWLGTSVEDQKWADVRIPKLLETPAAVRFLSCEPLLGPITFRWRPWIGYEPGWRERAETQNHLDALRGIDWVIVGGESGPGARPMHPDWSRALLDQCVEADVPFFFKQWGEYRASLSPSETWAGDTWVNARTGEVASERTALLGGDWTRVSRMGKKRAGRELDGRTWDEYPASLASLPI